jgi:hypothetical protein
MTRDAIKQLGAAHWLGVDLASEYGVHEKKQRLEIGPAAIDVGESEWIIWREGSWHPVQKPEEGQDLPIAHICQVLSQAIEWDVWDGALFYARLAIPRSQAPSAHLKLEDSLHSVRISSDKQISCLLDKQCFILRKGDWALKDNGRWHILRNAEDKRQMLSGPKSGELFVLENIDSRQRVIQGRYFFSNRSQMAPVEVMAVSARQHKKHPFPSREKSA